jgi:hypothetical protein
MKPQDGTCPLTQQQLIAEYFLEIRAKILDIAAFLDRMDRSVDHNAEDDFRIVTMRQALQRLCTADQGRVYDIQMIFSDPTTEPLMALDRKSALGAFDRRGAALHPPTEGEVQQ